MIKDAAESALSLHLPIRQSGRKEGGREETG
jgi:hypothetical protein